MKATEKQIELFFEEVIAVIEKKVSKIESLITEHLHDQELIESLMTATYNGPMGDYVGRTGLGIACKFGSVQLVQLCLPYSSTLTVDDNGDFPIHNALDAELVNPDIVTAVLERIKIEIPSPDSRTQLNSMGQSALSHSVALQDPDNNLRANITKQLLDAGLSPNAGSDAEAPLLAAIMLRSECRNDKIIDMLLDAGVEIRNGTPDYGNSLLIAASEGYKYAARAIYTKATKLNILDPMLQGIDRHDFSAWIESEEEGPFGGIAPDPYECLMGDSTSGEEEQGPADLPGSCEDPFTDQ